MLLALASGMSGQINISGVSFHSKCKIGHGGLLLGWWLRDLTQAGCRSPGGHTRTVLIRRTCGTGRHHATQSSNSEEAILAPSFARAVHSREHAARIAKGHAQEAASKLVVEEHISDSLGFRWLGEGTLADAVVRPSLHVDDSWIGVQLKSTQKRYHGSYSFFETNRYGGLLLLCLALDEELLWVIPGCDATRVITIRDGGKWDAHRCAWHDLSSSLFFAWNNHGFIKQAAGIWSTPRSPTQKTEFIAHKLALDLFRAAGLSVTAPLDAYGPVDMLLDGGIRVQNKSRTMGYKCSDNKVTLFRAGGKGTFRAYNADDFDVLIV